MANADRHGLPVAICIESATPHEVNLVVPTLIQMVIPEAPQNLIGDNAYDSDKLDTELSRLYCTKCGSPNSVEAQFCSRGGQPPMTILLGVLREKPVRITEKLSKAKPAIKKGGGMSGATLGLVLARDFT